MFITPQSQELMYIYSQVIYLSFTLVISLVYSGFGQGGGGGDRVATAQGKQGIWKSILTDRENTGKILRVQKK